jgi:2-C-methyl-D-erythritol 2,4-cyclodiphosphate synthase
LEDWRVGTGYDIHAVVADRPLRLGGVDVPCDFGLGGHSDGDVLLHAVVDALLGAAGLDDIGTHFPDTDPAYRGIDSRELLHETISLLTAQGWKVHNLDTTVVAEQPRLENHKVAIRRALADQLSVDTSRVAVKAKSNEGFDAVGAGQAIACHVVALIRRGGS